MSAPQAKRKVTGRVELGRERPGPSATPSPRTSANRVPLASSSRPVAASARARVSASEIHSTSPAHPAPTSSRSAYSSSTPSSAAPPLGQAQRASVTGAIQNTTSVPTSNYTFSSPFVRSPLHGPPTSQAPRPVSIHAATSPAIHTLSELPTSPNEPQPKVRASINGYTRQPERENAATRARVPSQSSTQSYFAREAPESRPAVRRQPSLANAGVKAQHRTSMALSDSFQVTAGGSPHSGPPSPSATSQRAPAQTRQVSHTAQQPSLGGSSALSSSSTGAISPGGFRRPSLTAGTFQQMPSFAQSFSPPRSLGESRARSRQASENYDVSGLSSPERTALWDMPTAGTSRDATFMTTSTSAGSGFPLLSPTQELDAEAQEAKVNRKILDLEISNKSLLAINSALEVTKLQQAREIRELKRRLREGLCLNSNAVGSGASMLDDLGSDDDNDDQLVVLDADAPLQAELEAAHARCKAMVDDMVQRARDAILSRPEPSRKISGNRVLHPAELEGMVASESLHRSGQQGNGSSDEQSGSGLDLNPSSDSETDMANSISVEAKSPVTPPSTELGLADDNRPVDSAERVTLSSSDTIKGLRAVGAS